MSIPIKYDLEYKLETVRMAFDQGVNNREGERRFGIE